MTSPRPAPPGSSRREPGTHLIDLYPMVFLGHGKGPWNYNIPFLSFAQDHPALTLGYRLPTYRLAIEVVR